MRCSIACGWILVGLLGTADFARAADPAPKPPTEDTYYRIIKIPIPEGVVLP